MERLPREILHNIFIQVSFRNRLECTLVCRQWYNILSKRSLLYHIVIFSDEVWNGFINLIEDQPSRASQVEIIVLVISYTFDKRIICNMLPNLREFTNQCYYDQIGNHSSNPLKLIHPNSKLEIIRDKNECELTRQLLTYGSCPQLRYLKLNLGMITNQRKEIFVHLKSAPALHKLVLDYCRIGIEDVETLHKNVIALKTLEMHNITLLAGTLPRDILPASTVTKLKIGIIKINDYLNHQDWYKYLANKYTHLESFDYHDSNIEKIEPANSMKLYMDGLFPIYKKIGIPLPSFVARNYPIELNPFKKMDEFGFRALNINLKDSETRPIFEQLVGSHQLQHIKSLNLHNTAIASPVLLKNFTTLTELYIDTGIRDQKRNVNLIDYFNSFPSTLKIFQAKFLDVEINNALIHPNNVEHLSLLCSTISPKLAQVISNYFPKVYRLAIHGRVKENIAFHLPDHHFQFLAIRVNYHGDPPYGFSITSKTDSQTRYYVGPDKYGHTQIATAEDLQDRAIISLNYTSVTDLYCNYIHAVRPDRFK